MTIGFVTASTGFNSVSLGTSVSDAVTAPASIASGNLLLSIPYVTHQGPGPSVTSWTVPSGWILAAHIDTQSAGGSGMMAVLYKIATGSEPSDYTFGATFGSASFMGLAVPILQYSGADTSGPQNAAFTQNPSADTQLAAPSIAGLAGQELICAWGQALGSGIGGGPSGMTQRATAIRGGFEACSAWDQALVSSGATGTRTATWGADISTAVSFAINPAPSTSPQAQLINAY